MKTAKGIIFDFNGTLFYDSKLHIKVFRSMLAEAGKTVFEPEYIVKNIFGMPNSAIYRNFFNENASDEECAKFAEEKERRYIEMCRKEHLPLVDGAPEMLGFLKDSGIPYAIATGSDLVNVEFYLNEIGINKWFSLDNILYSDGTFRGKPYPDIYIRAAQKLGLEPSECIIFEDAGSGIRAANAAGALGVIALREEGLPSPIDGTLKVDTEIPDFKNFKEVFEKYGLIK